MEREFHRWLATQIVTDARVQLGIGDDAAVLNPLNEKSIVVCTDSIAEGTHFDSGQHDLMSIGRKALGVNLSDIAAMGAEPVAALLNFQLPHRYSLRDAQQLFRGAKQLADRFHVAIVGGDTNTWDGPLVLGATVIGKTLRPLTDHYPWKMNGGQADDRILVTGQLGGSLLGHHLNFEPRVELAHHVAHHFQVKAATDISDSLSLDLAAIATQSVVGVEVVADHVPLAEAAHLASKQDGRSPLEHALCDGEDFELILVVDPTEAGRILSDSHLKHQITDIGSIKKQPGFRMIDPAGTRKQFLPSGYSH